MAMAQRSGPSKAAFMRQRRSISTIYIRVRMNNTRLAVNISMDGSMSSTAFPSFLVSIIALFREA